MSEKKKSKWEEIATAEAGSEGTPGQDYHLCEFALYRREKRYKATAHDCWGSNQGQPEIHGEHVTQGRADYPVDAIGAMRLDVFAWAGDDAEWRAELATGMRDLEYAAEDAEYEAGDTKGD